MRLRNSKFELTAKYLLPQNNQPVDCLHLNCDCELPPILTQTPGFLNVYIVYSQKPIWSHKKIVPAKNEI